MSIQLVGILNVTPDSFSDGGEFIAPVDAIARARSLKAAGADIIDIGGQSTRPGSSSVGVEEELRRLEQIVPALTNEMPISIDTYRAEIAEWAIRCGACIINDVTAGADPEMFSVIASRKVKIVLMFSPSTAPHDFSHLDSKNITVSNVVACIGDFFEKRIETAKSAGILTSQIILDPGMGAFLSSNPEVSWEVIRRFSELRSLGFPLMLASSRKGFLKATGEASPKERDPVSALTGLLVAQEFLFEGPDFIRTHNPALQKQFLQIGNLTRSSS